MNLEKTTKKPLNECLTWLSFKMDLENIKRDEYRRNKI